MRTRIAAWTCIGLALALGCGGDDSTDPQFTGTSAKILIRDTTMLVGESASFLIEVQYIFGPGAPSNAFWAVSDTSIITLDVISDGSAFLTAKKPGTVKLSAFINRKFNDTTTVTVIPVGAVRWQQDLGATSLSSVAIDDSDNVLVATTGPSLASYTSSGQQRWSVPACFNLMSASLRLDNGATITSGSPGGTTLCTRRHDRAGAAVWSAPVGSSDAGVALTADDGVIVLSSLGTAGGPGAVVVSRFNAAGTEVWRDTLDTQPLAQVQTPAIALSGDIYVPWRSPSAANASFLTRLTSAGVVRWTKPLAGWPHYTSPAIDHDRIYVAHQSGVVAFDSTGTVVWTYAYPASTETSSPVADAAGNVYTQSSSLRSFTSAGVLRWSADSLGFGSSNPVGAPTVVANNAVLVECKGEVCAVSMADGSLVWRSALGGGVGGTVGVSSEGTIFVERAASGSVQLVALWSHAVPVLAGWPTEGHDMQRSRRQF